MYLEDILKLFHDGKLNFEECLLKIKSMGYVTTSDIGKLDTYREQRTGSIEAILAEGKNIFDLLLLIDFYLKSKNCVLITRLNSFQLRKIRNKFQDKFIKIGKYKKTIIVSNNKDEK